MASVELLAICGSAFAAVFVLLTLLAAVMRLLMSLFPVKAGQTDAALLAAVSTALSATFPGMQVTKIEEQK